MWYRDLSKFEIQVLRRHTELFGDREELEKFREKFKITHQVLLDKEVNKWHLAFDGMMSDWIREIYVK